MYLLCYKNIKFPVLNLTKKLWDLGAESDKTLLKDILKDLNKQRYVMFMDKKTHTINMSVFPS